MTSLIESCYAVFGCWEACSFLKRNRETVDLGENREGGEELGGQNGGEGTVKLYYIRE